jgi:hypothetical protein
MDKRIKKVISIDNIFCKTVNVKQKINKKYLFDFLKTNLKINSYNHIVTHYIEDENIYSVIAINPKNSNIILEPQYLESLCDNKISKYTLFITSNYFALFYEQKLVYCKQLENIKNKDDIKFYIEQVFNIKNIDIKILHSNEYEQLKHKQNELKPLKYITKNSSNIVQDRYYKIFIVVVFIATISYMLNSYMKNLEKNDQQNKIDNKYQNFILDNTNKKQLIPQIENFFQLVSNSDIFINSAKIDKKRILLNINSNKKQNIFMLINRLKKYSVKVNFITYNKSKNIFESRIEFDTF